MSNQSPTKNQSEKEYFALAGTGRKGVEDMLSKMGDEIKAVASPNVSKEFDTWKIRALVLIANDETLRPIIQTRTGIFSIYQQLARAATMGLQIGGQFPHMHLVPIKGKAVMIPTAEGYTFCARYGPGHVLKLTPQLMEVYDKDEFRIDDAARTYIHNYDPFKERGKLVGFFTVLDFIDGRRMIPHVTIADVERIEREYGRTDNPAYKKSPFEMHQKTAMKKLLKPAVRESEALAMMMTLDDYEYTPPLEPLTPDMRDVTERMGDKLDSAIEGLEPGEKKEEPKAEKKPEPSKAESGVKKGDLF